MPLKINNLKFINNLKTLKVLFVTLLTINTLSSQEIIQEVEKEIAPKAKDSVSSVFTTQKVKIVYKYLILKLEHK